MTTERSAAVTFLGTPLTLVGDELKVGEVAPDFTAVTDGLELHPYSLADGKGKVRIFNIVISLDTPTCHAQTVRFNEEVAALPGVEVLTVSSDLPFAQARWAKQLRIGDQVRFLSDYRDLSFAASYGVLVKELRLLGRAIVVVDASDVIVHVEYVRELSDHPDYDAAVAAARTAAGL